MHILLIHQAFVLPGEPGGTRHFELGRHLVDNENQFTVVTSSKSYLTGESTKSSQDGLPKELVEGIRVLRAYTYPALHRGFIWRVLSFLSFMISSIWSGLTCGPVDLVMGTSPPIFQAFSAWLVSAIRRRPLLLEIRDLWPEFAIDMGILKNPILIATSKWLEGFLYARANHLLVNSPAYRDYLINRGIPAEKITLIPNGVDPAMFDPEGDGAEMRTRWKLEDKFVVTYAGALGIANDIPTILGAANHFKEQSDICFLLVGDGMKRPEMEEMSADMGLENVIFTGAVPKNEMVQVLSASNACVATLQDIPMFRTTYPNKVFDYMAAGRPTILGIDGVIREVIEQADGGIFVQPGDSKALANAVQTLYSEPCLAQEMGQSSRQYVIEHFNRAEHAQRFVELIATFAAKEKTRL